MNQETKRSEIPNIKRGILISLDDIFDTRFAFMLTLNPEITRKYYQSRYRKRYCDEEIANLFGLSYTEWLERWDKRSPLLYRSAIRTKMLTMISEIMIDNDTLPADEGIDKRFVLTINTDSYELTRSTRDAIEKSLRLLLGPNLPIGWIAKPLKELEPRFVIDEFSYVIMYHWQEWLYHWRDTDPGISLTNTTLIVPKLFGHVLDEAQLAEINSLLKEGLDPLTMITEAFVSPAFTLRYESIHYWNFPDNIDPKRIMGKKEKEGE